MFHVPLRQCHIYHKSMEFCFEIDGMFFVSGRGNPNKEI